MMVDVDGNYLVQDENKKESGKNNRQPTAIVSQICPTAALSDAPYGQHVSPTLTICAASDANDGSNAQASAVSEDSNHLFILRNRILRLPSTAGTDWFVRSHNQESSKTVSHFSDHESCEVAEIEHRTSPSDSSRR
jgi:hypothetical protein